MILNCYFDGACHQSSTEGIIGYGFHINLGVKEIYATNGFPLYSGTSNISEYTALASLLEFLITSDFLINMKRKHEAKKINLVIHGDSQLIIKQMVGEYQVNKESLKTMNELCVELLNKLPTYAKFRFVWHRREFNQRADQLSKIGLNKALKYFSSEGLFKK